MDQHRIVGTHYGFSATRIADLGAAEYTLVAIAADRSGSVAAFAADIERCLGDIVSACRRSPRADNLMMRAVAFDSSLVEIHGYKPLAALAPDDYQGKIRSGGSTALCDAAHDAVESIVLYGKHLVDNDFDVNGIVFVVTDGCDNASQIDAATVRRAVETTRKGETLESLVTILVGVGIQDPAVSQSLAAFRKEAGFDQYVELAQADAAALAKLADFVGRSIALQSLALGSGSASTSLSF
jgi:hypothetical protein